MSDAGLFVGAGTPSIRMVVGIQAAPVHSTGQNETPMIQTHLKVRRTDVSQSKQNTETNYHGARTKPSGLHHREQETKPLAKRPHEARI